MKYALLIHLKLKDLKKLQILKKTAFLVFVILKQSIRDICEVLLQMCKCLKLKALEIQKGSRCKNPF